MGTNRKIHFVLTSAGAAGIVGLFLPFAYETSPMKVVIADTDGFWRLALPLFLSILIAAGATRWMISGSLSRREKLLAYFASAVGAASTLLMCLESDWDPLLLIPPFVLAAGVFFLRSSLKTRPSSSFTPVMAMQVAYASSGLLSFAGFYKEWQVGAYFVLVAVIAYFLQIIVVIRASRGASI
jgi:hypothetical protein